MKYRAEIDGLRAFAIMPVIFYHAGIELFKGGFVGVDIFFVISGYLITSIIIEDMKINRFNIYNFYERRARRILPALFFVTFICLLVGYNTLAPQYFKTFSQSIVASQIFSSNILFWLTANYFDTSSDLKPLLHTWSLAVEEQFYLIYPFLLVAFKKYLPKNNNLIKLLIVLFCVSLLLNLIFGKIFPMANFYLLHSRAWELLLGCIAAIVVASNANVVGSVYSRILSNIGLLLIIFSFVCIDKKLSGPNLFFLIPTLGAALILIYPAPESISNKILSRSILVSIGLHSFSAYLWHQPVLVFFRHLNVNDIDGVAKLKSMILIIVLSIFTVKYIEKPFRDITFFSARSFFKMSVFFSLVFITVGMFGHFTNGLNFRTAPNHLPENYFKLLEKKKIATVGLDGKLCFSETDSMCIANHGNNLNAKNFLLVGDSHSGDYTNIYRNFLIMNNYNGHQMSVSGCGFIANHFKRHNGGCGRAYQKLIKHINSEKIDVIIFVTSIYDNLKSEEDFKSFYLLMDSLRRATNKLILFTPRLILTGDPIRAANLNRLYDITYIKSPEYNKIDDMLTNLAETNSNIYIYDQMEPLFALSKRSREKFNAHSFDNIPFYIDTNHLTDYSADIIFNDFIKNSTIFID